MMCHLPFKSTGDRSDNLLENVHKFTLKIQIDAEAIPLVAILHTTLPLKPDVNRSDQIRP